MGVKVVRKLGMGIKGIARDISGLLTDREPLTYETGQVTELRGLLRNLVEVNSELSI